MIEVLDAKTGIALDTRQVSDFTKGKYEVWSVSGDIIIRLSGPKQGNAVCSGIFFDPPITPLAQWKSEHFTEAEAKDGFANDDADLDGDGIANLFEYAFGLDPRRRDEAAPMSVRIEENSLVVTFNRLKAAVDVSVLIELSSDLISWHPPGSGLEVLTVEDRGVVASTIVRLPDPLQDQAFVRLRAVRR